jgi:copper resistance protein C
MVMESIIMRHINMRHINIVLLALLLAGSTPAAAHARLDHANPAAGSTVASPPGAVSLYFTEQLEPQFSRAEVRNPAGSRVDTGTHVSGKVMQISVSAMPSGTYKVTWHVTSVDTHKTQGSFSFTVGK